MMNWINVEQQLPPEGRYVLIHIVKDNWRDSQDQDGVYFKVAKFVEEFSWWSSFSVGT